MISRAAELSDPCQAPKWERFRLTMDIRSIRAVALSTLTSMTNKSSSSDEGVGDETSPKWDSRKRCSLSNSDEEGARWVVPLPLPLI